MTERQFNPAYVYARAASNRLTDAHTELQRLRFVIPRHQQSDAADLYNRVCTVQGAVERLLGQLEVWTEEEA